MRIERLSFFVKSVQAVPGGWRLEGEPGYHPRNWARPGDSFDRVCRDNGGQEREVDLVVVELNGSYAIVAGTGGDQLGRDDVVSGGRLREDLGHTGQGPRRQSDATEDLAGILGLPSLAGAASAGGAEWSLVEAALGVTLPADYKRFVDAYGAGLVDDHVTVCAPHAPHEWADLVRHNTWAQECVRLDFAGPDSYSEDWYLGDPSHWEPNHEDVPPWFEPGDNLVSWGHTGNGDLLFWHVKPGVAAGDWPAVLKEEGPYWEQYGVGFSAALAGLLTGEIQSEYLSHWLGGPHSYHL
ncbi:hypothetical protein [Micromonospora sp. CPCC 206061]|uniref:hypothetical protein n=1 Tax=Micromonospora sp. CPCC 206061 TaxID=3122410 RepID=UPI002FF0A006